MARVRAYREPPKPFGMCRCGLLFANPFRFCTCKNTSHLHIPQQLKVSCFQRFPRFWGLTPVVSAHLRMQGGAALRSLSRSRRRARPPKPRRRRGRYPALKAKVWSLKLRASRSSARSIPFRIKRLDTPDAPGNSNCYVFKCLDTPGEGGRYSVVQTERRRAELAPNLGSQPSVLD